MSYQVIARKWRPQSFTDLVGQHHVSQTLLNALKNDRLPHALLFSGPRGTGKTSSARILAKALRCTNLKDFTPCNECSDCIDIAQGKNIDVAEIDGASHNGVDSIRELKEGVGYMPSSGKYKIYIIDEVHMLSTSAFNALLKTLEEPPEHALFILATTEVHKIPDTILSRCQRFDFRRIATSEIVQHLERICTAEKLDFESNAIWAIARQADGSMRDSQSLLDQIITFSEGNITLEQTIKILGLTDRMLLIDILTAVIQQDQNTLIQKTQNLFTSGFDSFVFIKELMEEIRNLLLVNLNPDSSQDALDIPQSEFELLKELATQIGQDDIHILFDMVLKGAQDIYSAQSPQITLEMLLLKVSSAPKFAQISSLLQASSLDDLVKSVPVEPVKIKSTSTTTPPAHAADSVNVAQPPIEKKKTYEPPKQREPLNLNPNKSLPEQWLKTIQVIKSHDHLLGTKLDHTHLLSLDNNLIIFGIPEKMQFLYSQINKPQLFQQLTKILEELTHINYSFEIKNLTPNTNQEITPRSLEDKQIAKEKEQTLIKIKQHPLIQKVQNTFDSKITHIKELS